MERVRWWGRSGRETRHTTTAGHGVLHRVLGVPHRVLGVLHRVLGVQGTLGTAHSNIWDCPAANRGASWDALGREIVAVPGGGGHWSHGTTKNKHGVIRAMTLKMLEDNPGLNPAEAMDACLAARNCTVNVYG